MLFYMRTKIWILYVTKSHRLSVSKMKVLARTFGPTKNGNKTLEEISLRTDL
jgi:hypothetical protein